MKKEVTKGIKFIKSGEIHYYFGIKLESNISHIALGKGLEKMVSNIMENYNIAIHQSLLDASKQTLQNCQDLKMKLTGTTSKKRYSKIELNKEDLNAIVLDPAINGMRVTLDLKQVKSYNSTKSQMLRDYEEHANICGLDYGEKYIAVVLPPFRLHLKSGGKVYNTAVLYIFNNNMAILRISLPLKNISAKYLFNNEYSSHYKEISNVCNLPVEIDGTNVYSLVDAYRYLITKYKKLSMVILPPIEHITLSDFTKQPQHVDEISEEIMEDFFRISCAPVRDRPCSSYRKEAIRFFYENKFQLSNIVYITNAKGKCLSFLDTSFTDFVNSELEQIDFTNKVLRMNAEYTLFIIILKKLITSTACVKQTIFSNDFHKIQKEYNMNTIFISELQKNCYGTVLEQLEFFETKMKYFVDKSNTTRKMEAISNIITNQQKRQFSELQKFLSIVSLFITGIFGLPAINETLLMIKKLWVVQDIPWITINIATKTIWIICLAALLLGTIIKPYFFDRFNNKNIFKK